MRLPVFAAALLAASGAIAQPAAQPRRIAVLEHGDKLARAAGWRLFEARLGELGYVEGKGAVFVRGWAEGVDARLPAIADELLAARPDIVIATTTPATQALMRATTSVPIVFIGSADPVAAGMVASLARPGGNVTGLSAQLTDVNEKRFGLMREMLPRAKRFGLLGPSNAGVLAVLKRLQASAQAVGAEVRLLEASDAGTIERAFEQLRSARIDALLVASALVPHNAQIVSLAAKFRVPASYIHKDALEAGGLLVFGPDSDAYYRRGAEYVHRILAGERPANIPVEQPKGFWLGVNLRTARTLGLHIPQSVLIGADRVIE